MRYDKRIIKEELKLINAFLANPTKNTLEKYLSAATTCLLHEYAPHNRCKKCALSVIENDEIWCRVSDSYMQESNIAEALLNLLEVKGIYESILGK